MHKTTILLPTGGSMEVEYTPQLLDKIRIHLGVDHTYVVTDDDIRRFFRDSFSSAIEKASDVGYHEENVK